MGKVIDLTGQKFGRWTVLERAEKPANSTSSSAFWKCRCDCGTEKIISGNVLRQGKSKSCGCLNKEPRAKDLTGQRFGKLTVLKRAPRPDYATGLDAYWLCRCDCGKEKVIMGKSLRNGKTITCGCHCDKVTDLTGRKFGKLTVLKLDSFSEKGNGSYWICECECGNIISTQASNLISGSVKSCGCLVSTGELEISNLLTENNIDFKTQYSFKDLNSVAGYPLRFDFAVFKDNKLEYLIEFQGEQHYEYNDSKFFDRNVLINDLLKKDYCKKNNIKLSCIPYWQRGKITLDLISKYIGSEDN